MGYPATVLVRSVPLRGFDQQMAQAVCNEMEERGVKFHHKCVPTAVEKLQNGQLKARWFNNETQQEWVHLTPKAEQQIVPEYNFISD